MKKLNLFLIVSVILSSCMSSDNSSGNKEAANAERMQEFYDQVMNAHNPALIDSFVAAEFVDHQPFPGYPEGIEGLKAGMRDFFAAYPDLKIRTNFINVSGDTVISHMTMTGTNTAPYMGMPATNKEINIDGVDIIVMKDGKATEHWGFMEEMKMMEQLGMGPGAGEAAPAEEQK